MTDLDDINVLFRDLPSSVGGLTSKDENGDYVIILNARCDSVRQRITYEHELEHIKNRDLEETKDKNACCVEEQRHQYKSSMRR